MIDRREIIEPTEAEHELDAATPGAAKAAAKRVMQTQG
jgi:hypothetical protein